MYLLIVDQKSLAQWAHVYKIGSAQNLLKYAVGSIQNNAQNVHKIQCRRLGVLETAGPQIEQTTTIREHNFSRSIP